MFTFGAFCRGVLLRAAEPLTVKVSEDSTGQQIYKQLQGRMSAWKSRHCCEESWKVRRVVAFVSDLNNVVIDYSSSLTVDWNKFRNCSIVYCIFNQIIKPFKCGFCFTFYVQLKWVNLICLPPQQFPGRNTVWFCEEHRVATKQRVKSL